MTTPDAPRKNTDREIWRDGDSDGYYTPDCASIFVTEGGGIGISVNGNVIVRPVREWHRALSQAGGEHSCPRCGSWHNKPELGWATRRASPSPSVSVERELDYSKFERAAKAASLPDTPQSVPTCTCSKHPLWDGYDGDCPIHGWFEPVAPDTPQSVPAAGDDELAVRAERDRLKAERTYYRDMWLAQRVENENFRKQLGLVPVSDEAERALTPRSTTPTDAHSKE
jgi:hypothetical protein